MRSSSSAATGRRAEAGVSPWSVVDLGEVASDPQPFRPGDALTALEVEPDSEEGPEVGVDPAVLEAMEERERELRAALEAERMEHEQREREAYERGVEAGRQMESERIGGALSAVDAAVSEIRSSGSRWVVALEENVCALAVAVARHILGRELEGDRLAVLDLVRSAMSRFGMDESLKIRVSEADHAVLTAGKDAEEEIAALVAGREVVWVADASIGVGGCVVEGPERIVDGRIDTALDRVYRRLTQSGHG